MTNYNIEHKEGLEFLKDVKNDSIDLILTDPPYIISKNSGMQKYYKKCEQLDKDNEKEWEIYKKKEIENLQKEKDAIVYHDDNKIKINTSKNPRKGGAPLSRRNIYKDGMTVKEAKKQIKDTSIKYDLKLQYIIYEKVEEIEFKIQQLQNDTKLHNL